MAIDNESFNKDLYNLLKVRGYNPVPLDYKNQRVPASQSADVIQFTFNKDGEEYGKSWITIDDAQNIIVYYDDEQQDSPSTTTPGVEYDDTWTGLLKHLKQWAQRRQLSFELANKDRLGDDMRQREYYKMKEKLGESYHPMGKKASYNDAVPNVKIILQHNRSLEEGEQRYRNVARIFLENQEGERFLAPTTRPGIARVYARHIAEGGLPNDEKWNHIKSICEDYNKMGGFVRATKNGQFNESAQALVNEGVNYYTNLRETLHKLSTHRGYQAYFESWTPTLMEGEGSEDISEMFMSQSLDPRIESAMPILARLKKPVTEMSEVDSLAEWADDIISEKLGLDEDSVIPGAGQKTFQCSCPPLHEPINIKAASEDEAKKEAAKKWGCPIEKVKVAQVDDTTTATPDEEQPSISGGPLDKAKEKAAPKPKEKSPSMDFSKMSWPDIAKFAISTGIVGEGDVVKFPKGWVKTSDEGDDEMDWDDESWIPSEEEFEREEELRNRKHKPANDLEEMDKSIEANPYHGWGHSKNEVGHGPEKTGTPVTAKQATKKAGKELNKAFKKAFKDEVDESDAKKNAADTKKTFPNVKHLTKGGHPDWKKHGIDAPTKDEVDEALTPVPSGHKGLNKQQKSVGQVGATEKAKNISPVLGKEPKQHPFKGKLVGASESTEIDQELARIMEIAKFNR